MLIFNCLLYVLFLLLFSYICFYIYRYRKDYEKICKIPGPLEHFLLGHVYLLTADTDLLFARMRQFSNEFRPIYRFSTPYINVINFLDPADIEIIMSSTKHLSKSKIYTFLNNWLGTGLLTSTGLKWHKRRKILTPAFHFSILNQFLTVFNEETNKLLQKLKESCRREKTIDVVPEVTQFTLQSIAETAMGLTTIDEDAKKKYKNALFRITEIFLKRLSNPWFRINFIYNWSQLARDESATVKSLHDFSSSIIKQREAVPLLVENSSKKKRLAMLDLLLAAKSAGEDIDFEGIREEVDTFMFEGHDTTAMAISFLLLTLANLPEVQKKILDEILQIMGEENLPTYNHLQELKYTERCIKETLRLFPSVPFISRYASEDFTTHTGYFIPKGTVLHIHIFDLHRDPHIYPNPLEFDPDRFLPEQVNARHPFSYIPFSAGPRNCIGQRFALLELKTVLCGVLRKFKLKKVDDMCNVKFKSDLVLRPRHPIKVKFVLRETQTVL